MQRPKIRQESEEELTSAPRYAVRTCAMQAGIYIYIYRHPHTLSVAMVTSVATEERGDEYMTTGMPRALESEMGLWTELQSDRARRRRNKYSTSSGMKQRTHLLCCVNY